MKLRFGALGLALAIVALACAPPAMTRPGPDPDRWLNVLQRTIAAAINVVFGHPPSNTNIDCAVIIFDAAVDGTTFQTEYTPVHTPNDIYAWITGCLGAGAGPHRVPTFKATGFPNTPNPDKQAVCWATSWPPNGNMRFPCTFDRDPHLSWVTDVRLSRDGYMAVGVVS